MDRTHDPRVTRREASHYVTETQFPNITMYVRSAKTQACSLCIDPLDKASWIARSPKKVHTARSAKGLIRMCCCSRTVYPALDSPAIEDKYDQRMLLSEYAVGRLTRVFARRTRRFVKPRDCRRYIRLAKALIRLLMCRLRVCMLIRLFVQVVL